MAPKSPLHGSQNSLPIIALIISSTLERLIFTYFPDHSLLCAWHICIERVFFLRKLFLEVVFWVSGTLRNSMKLLALALWNYAARTSVCVQSAKSICWKWLQKETECLILTELLSSCPVWCFRVQVVGGVTRTVPSVPVCRMSHFCRLWFWFLPLCVPVSFKEILSMQVVSAWQLLWLAYRLCPAAMWNILPLLSHRTWLCCPSALQSCLATWHSLRSPLCRGTRLGGDKGPES